jgi:hypothetical protein
VKVQALLREWSPSNKEFIDLVLSEFPDKGVATVEEARVRKRILSSCSPNGAGQCCCAVTKDLSFHAMTVATSCFSIAAVLARQLV